MDSALPTRRTGRTSDVFTVAIPVSLSIVGLLSLVFVFLSAFGLCAFVDMAVAKLGFMKSAHSAPVSVAVPLSGHAVGGPGPYHVAADWVAAPANQQRPAPVERPAQGSRPVADGAQLTGPSGRPPKRDPKQFRLPPLPGRVIEPSDLPSPPQIDFVSPVGSRDGILLGLHLPRVIPPLPDTRRVSPKKSWFRAVKERVTGLPKQGRQTK